jgi:hypothetical protein
MPTISEAEAAEKLARSVERASPSDLPEIYSELFPEESPPASLVASDIARHIRSGIEPEEIVDLWNVVFPEDHNVWYNEEDGLTGPHSTTPKVASVLFSPTHGSTRNPLISLGGEPSKDGEPSQPGPEVV